jgi:glycyl-tRNA synthetase
MVDCKETKLRFRADQLYFAPVVVNGERLGYVCVQESDDVTMIQEAKRQAKAVLKGTSIRKGEEKVDHEPFEFRELIQANEEELAQIPSPASGKPTLTPPRDFNLMFQTYVGAMTDATSVAYLRPETAQGIFLNFKNVQTTSRMKIPFGIAQIGKAFRNEITPRNFIFRSREFEQMEIEYFIEPGDDVWQGYHEMWLQESRRFLVETIGLREDLLGWDVHEGDGLAHYARACTDITFQFPFGTQELMGIAARGDYDLRQHSDGSGKSTVGWVYSAYGSCSRVLLLQSHLYSVSLLS